MCVSQPVVCFNCTNFHFHEILWVPEKSLHHHHGQNHNHLSILADDWAGRTCNLALALGQLYRAANKRDLHEFAPGPTISDTTPRSERIVSTESLCTDLKKITATVREYV